eukprot:jgi/Galph1/2292/GphlegSOOS_G982.1
MTIQFVSGFPPKPAPLVNTFNDYPFFVGTHTIRWDTSYIKDLSLNALPYIGVGTCLCIVALMAIVIRYTWLRKKVTAYQNSKLNKTPRTWITILTAILILLFGAAASFGFLGVNMMVRSLTHDEQSFHGSIHWMSASAQFFENSFSSTGLQAQLNTSFPYYSQVLDKLQQIENESIQFSNEMNDVLSNAMDIYRTVHHYSPYAFYGAYGLMGLFVLSFIIFIYFIHFQQLWIRISLSLLIVFIMWLSWIVLSIMLMSLWSASDACSGIYNYFETKNFNALPSVLSHFIPNETSMPTISIGNTTLLQEAVKSSFQSQIVPVIQVLNQTIDMYNTCTDVANCEVSNMPISLLYLHSCSSDRQNDLLRGHDASVMGAVFILTAMACYCVGFFMLMVLSLSNVDPKLGHRTKMIPVPIDKKDNQYSSPIEIEALPRIVEHFKHN